VRFSCHPVLQSNGEAVGIALGYAMDLAFLNVGDHGIRGLNWRLMVGSAGIPAAIMAAQVYLVPESPRWLIGKGRPQKAFEAIKRLRFNEVQAARDLFYMSILLHEEEQITRGKNLLIELFTVPRNRRAALASGIVMFMQQFCGVNVIV
jgi:MFS family permease